MAKKYKGGSKMRHQKESGITLIALIITIIVLLILAGISIMSLTGENGILKKAEIARKNTEIAKVKEEIKLELMGSFGEEKTNYTNQDVIHAVKKITNQEVEEGTAMVENIDISDLWIKEEIKEEPKYYFTITDTTNSNIQCYFTAKDAGFQFDSSGKAMCYYDEWINNHINGISCVPIIGEEYQIVNEKGGFIDLIDHHTLIKEGNTKTLDVNNLATKIHYND